MLTRWFNLAPRVFFARGFAQPVPADVMRMHLAPWRDRDRRLPAAIAPRQLVAASGYLADLEATLPVIGDRPTLIVWGQRDFAFREAARQRFEKLFPDHRTVLLAGASHFLQEDAGEQIAAEIRKSAVLSGGGPAGLGRAAHCRSARYGSQAPAELWFTTTRGSEY